MMFLLVLLEPAELLLLLAPDDFEELGDDVDALFADELALVALLLELLLLLFELPPPPPELEDPEDCFSFLSLIIIYTSCRPFNH